MKPEIKKQPELLLLLLAQSGATITQDRTCVDFSIERVMVAPQLNIDYLKINSYPLTDTGLVVSQTLNCVRPEDIETLITQLQMLKKDYVSNFDAHIVSPQNMD